MKNIIILVLFLCFINVVSFGQTQMEMNHQASTNFKKADAKMALIYKKVQKETPSDIDKTARRCGRSSTSASPSCATPAPR